MKTSGAWLRVLGPFHIIMLGVVQIVLLMLWLDFLDYLIMKLFGWRRILRQRWMRCIWILVF